MTFQKGIIEAQGQDPRVLLIYGQAKVGKTTIIESLENKYPGQVKLMEFDKGGADFIRGDISYFKSWKEFDAYLEELRQEIVKQMNAKADNPYPYTFGVIDPITILADLCENKALYDYSNTTIGKTVFEKNKGITSILDTDTMSKWLFYRQALSNYMDLIERLFKRVIYIGHVKEKLEGKDGNMVTSKDLMLTGQLSNIVMSKTDANALLYRDSKNNLMINFKGNENVIVGSRPKHLRGMNDTFDWSKIYIEEYNK